MGIFKRILGVSLSAALAVTGLSAGMVSASAAEPTEKVKVACVGDSITQGQGTNLNWPDNLQNMLGDRYEVKNFGKGGSRVREYWPHDNNQYNDYWYKSEQYIGSTEYDADIVIVMMGTNDGYFNEAGEAKDYFATDYTKMIQPYLENGSKIYITTPTHAYAGTHTRVNDEIYNEVVALQKSLQAQYPEQIMDLVDMNRLTDGMPECFPDGLHGNTGGYAAIASNFYEQIFQKIDNTLPDLATVSVETEPGATVTIGLNIRKADDNGVATMKMLDGTYELEVLKSNFQRVVDTIEVTGNTTLEYPLVPGEINIALGKDAEASSYENYADLGTNYPPQLAFDGDTSSTSRWAVDYKKEGINDGAHPWLMVDLGEVMSFNGVRFYWYDYYGTAYDIQISNDKNEWTTVLEVTDNQDTVDSRVLEQVEARYVRIVFNACNNPNADKDAVSIYEMQVLQNMGGGEWTEPDDGEDDTTQSQPDTDSDVQSQPGDGATTSDPETPTTGVQFPMIALSVVAVLAVACVAVICLRKKMTE